MVKLSHRLKQGAGRGRICAGRLGALRGSVCVYESECQRPEENVVNLRSGVGRRGGQRGGLVLATGARGSESEDTPYLKVEYHRKRGARGVRCVCEGAGGGGGKASLCRKSFGQAASGYIPSTLSHGPKFGSMGANRRFPAGSCPSSVLKTLMRAPIPGCEGPSRDIAYISTDHRSRGQIIAAHRPYRLANHPQAT